MSTSPRSRSISNPVPWKALLVLLAAGWLGAGAARAQIDDLSQQVGVNTTTSLSPGVDPTNIHRDFDPTKKLVKPLVAAQNNAARLDTNPPARTKGRIEVDPEAVAATSVKSQIKGRAAGKTRAADTRNRALLKKDMDAAGSPARGGKTAAPRGEGNASERHGALLEPMTETRK